MPRDRLRLGAAIGVQLLILALVPARQVMASWRGQELTLATAPVDPHDPFSGAYVRLAYQAERLLPGMPGPAVDEGSLVYVVVERAEPAWRLVAIAAEPPPPASGRAALRATWHAGGARIESAGRLYLTSEKAQAAERALAEQRRRWWEAQQAASQARQATPASSPEPDPPRPPDAWVDLRVDEAGNVRLLRLRVDGQVFGE